MPLDIAAVQASLAAAGLDGWLLYDFHGSNPIAQSLAGLTHAAKMTTRRWYYYIPAEGEPRGLVHAIERHNLDATARHRCSRTPVGASLDEGLDALLAGTSRIAMEYSPGCDIPYLSRVDAGTLESVRAAGRRGRLVGRPGAAVRGRLDAGPDRHPCGRLRRPLPHQGSGVRRVAAGGHGRLTTTEYALQQQMVGWFAEEGLVSSDPPVVAVMANAGNPHYLPTAFVTSAHRTRPARAP